MRGGVVVEDKEVSASRSREIEESLAPVGSVRRGVIPSLLFRRSTRLPLVLTRPVSLEFLNKRPLGWVNLVLLILILL